MFSRLTAQKNLLETVTPKQAAIGGLIASVLSLGVIGMVIFLFVIVSDGSFMNRLGIVKGGRVGIAPITGTNPTPSTTGTVPPISSKDHIRGDQNAPITLIEYSDYECPYCKSFHPTMQQLVNDLKGKVRWVYRDFPLSFHQNAQKEAEASECVAELGGNDAFWSFTDKLFEQTTSNGTGFPLSNLSALASGVGVDRKKFEDCLNSNKYAAPVQAEASAGLAAGVNATPSLIIMNKQGKTQLVTGAVPVATITAAIESLSQ